MQNFGELVKDLFTLRTVWIDKGNGKWAVKKRFHPVVRVFLCVVAIFSGVGLYANFSSLNAVDAVAQTEIKPVKTARLYEPEKIQNIQPEVQEAKTANNLKTENTILIPLKNLAKSSVKSPIKKSESANSLVLPSEKKPETDMIIKKIPKAQNDGKYHITVSKSKYTLSLFKGNELVKEYPVAVGKNPGDKQYVGDHRTPVGNFHVVSIENASSWKHDFRDGKGKIAGAYGPWFLRLDANGWKGIGIHGTHDPDSRGTNATEGCIRLSNEDISELKQYAYRNMPVVIREN